MTDISKMKIPEDLLYTEDHEWIKSAGESCKIGITDFAQNQLGDIVFVEFPEVGAIFEKGEEFGSIESVKAVAELYLPVSGEILAVNNQLEDTPEFLNSEPYENWIIEIKMTEPNQLDQLMNSVDYTEMISKSE